MTANTLPLHRIPAAVVLAFTGVVAQGVNQAALEQFVAHTDDRSSAIAHALEIALMQEALGSRGTDPAAAPDLPSLIEQHGPDVTAALDDFALRAAQWRDDHWNTLTEAEMSAINDARRAFENGVHHAQH